MILQSAFNAVRAPFEILSGARNRMLQDRFRVLSDPETGAIVFNLASGAAEAGIDQADYDTARAEALKIATQLGTRLSYESRKECEAKHHSFAAKEVIVPSVVPETRAVGLASQTHVIGKYRPDVVGVVFARGLPHVAAPLYAGVEKNIAVRKDGVSYPLPGTQF